MNELAKKLLAEKKVKAIEMIGKKIDLGVTGKAYSIDEKNFTATFVMSTSAIDRHGDIVDQDSWDLKDFIENPYFALQHKSDEFPIGRWLSVTLENDPNIIGAKRLIGIAKFSVDIDENAKRAWDHVVAGNMNMVSVGFIPHRVDYDEEKDAFVLFDCELVECSLVGIGSNRQALVKTVNLEDSERKDVIEVKDYLDIAIKEGNTARIISLFKARENLNKAIRRMKAM